MAQWLYTSRNTKLNHYPDPDTKKLVVNLKTMKIPLNTFDKFLFSGIGSTLPGTRGKMWSSVYRRRPFNNNQNMYVCGNFWVTKYVVSTLCPRHLFNSYSVRL